MGHAHFYLASLSIAGLMHTSLSMTNNGSNPIIYDFADIIPTPDLRWTPCYENFTCARLEVPLDYIDPSLGTTTIAYIRRAATSKPVEEAESILFNPGGPGGSGVDIILTSGDMLASSVGPDYNLVGFDPRGVNNSGPSLDCFPGRPEVNEEFASRFRRPIDGKNIDSIVDSFVMAGGIGDWCSRTHSNDSAKYANTPAVAHDMLNFAEKNAEANGKVAREAKVWYWGLSYGSVLGATFSALFPDRVGRVILDGVADVEDYYEGKWTKGLVDADKAVESFGKFCHDAGPDHCAFYFDTPDKILAQIRNVMEDLRRLPIAVTDPRVTDSPRLVTYEDLGFVIFSALYTPSMLFPPLAEIFRDLQSRNGSSLLQAAQFENPTALNYGGLILCMDAAGRYNLSTVEKWQHHIDVIRSTTTWAADSFSTVPLLCRQMNIVPPVSQQYRGYPSANHTSFPLLFIGNTIDHATPIRNAYKMSGKFPGSVVLTQNSVGHVSISSVSRCTAENIQAYLGGKLPATNTTCEVDEIPFLNKSPVAIKIKV